MHISAFALWIDLAQVSYGIDAGATSQHINCFINISNYEGVLNADDGERRDMVRRGMLGRLLIDYRGHLGILMIHRVSVFVNIIDR